MCLRFASCDIKSTQWAIHVSKPLHMQGHMDSLRFCIGLNSHRALESVLDITSATTVPATALHIHICLTTPLMYLHSEQLRNASARKHKRQPTSDTYRLGTAPQAHQPSRFETKQSTTQHSTEQHSSAQHSTAQHSIAQTNSAKHSTAQHGTAQHSRAEQITTQHNTTRYNTAQHNTTHLCDTSAIPLR